MTKDIEREAFEEAYQPDPQKSPFPYFLFNEEKNLYEAHSFDGREVSLINAAWWGWQAAKAHEAEKLEGCVVVPTTPSHEMWSGIARHLGRYMQMHHRYCPKTLKKYFDRFIGDTPEWLNKEVKDWDSDHAFATADLPAFIYMSMVEAARGGNE